MPLRAILSTLVILIGTLSGSAVPVTTAARNLVFQPRPNPHAPVLKPAQARILGGEQRVTFNVQKITPIWQAPALNNVGRGAFSRPAGAVMRPAVIKIAGGG